jgi:steroid 5-alpha reductase family enzyme
MEALQAAFPLPIAVLAIVAALGCAIGFYKLVYFMSVGYGIAVALLSISMMVMSFTPLMPSMGWQGFILCALLIVYGCRLSGFLIYREAKSASFKKRFDKIYDKKQEKKVPFFVLFTIWISVIVLYVCEVSPIFYRTMNEQYEGTANIVLPLLGAAIMVFALILESTADHQKSAAKKVNPKRFVDTGLYRYVRCPNYLGEILFWTGVFVSGCNCLNGWAQWVVAIFGYLCLVYVMLSGAKRLEKRQNKSYGEDIEYQAYVKKTPILFRLIPVKSIINWKWIV